MAAHVTLPADDTLPGQRIEMRRGDFLRVQRIEQHVRIALRSSATMTMMLWLGGDGREQASRAGRKRGAEGNEAEHMTMIFFGMAGKRLLDFQPWRGHSSGRKISKETFVRRKGSRLTAPMPVFGTELVRRTVTPLRQRYFCRFFFGGSSWFPPLPDEGILPAVTSLTDHLVMVRPLEVRVLTGTRERSKSNSRTRAPLRPSREAWRTWACPSPWH